MRKPVSVHRPWPLFGIVGCLSMLLAACTGETTDPMAPTATTGQITAGGQRIGGPRSLRGQKVDLCHLNDAGAFHLINVSTNAEAAHLAHGDAKPGEPVPGEQGFSFDENCVPVFVFVLQIDLDGKVDGFGFASKEFAFPAGTFELTPIGTADGGLYDAVNTWAGRPGNKWEWAYLYSSPSLGSNHIWDWNRYVTAADALANGVTHSFTLSSAENVGFGVNDCPGCLGDNSGGISIKVVQIAGAP